MTSFAELLRHARRGSFFALDIDDTIYTNKYHPCKLMSQDGVDAFRAVLSSPPYRQQPYAVKNAHVRRLQKALKQKKMCEGQTTARVIKVLQEAGCWVFGLTARYAEMAKTTTRVLRGFGLDMSSCAPFPKEKVLKDPVTGALMHEGVIYANAQDKGMILDRFLSNVVFREILKTKSPRSTALPPEIVFVDDRRVNVDSVADGLSIASNLDIRVTCYHYQPNHSSGHLVPPAGASPMSSPTLAPLTTPRLPSYVLSEDPVLQTQIRWFLDKEEVLDDYEAETRGKKNWQHPEDSLSLIHI